MALPVVCTVFVMASPAFFRPSPVSLAALSANPPTVLGAGCGAVGGGGTPSVRAGGEATAGGGAAGGAVSGMGGVPGSCAGNITVFTFPSHGSAVVRLTLQLAWPPLCASWVMQSICPREDRAATLASPPMMQRYLASGPVQVTQ